MEQAEARTEARELLLLRAVYQGWTTFAYTAKVGRMFIDTSERIEYITRKYNDSHALADALEERVEYLQSKLDMRELGAQLSLGGGIFEASPASPRSPGAPAPGGAAAPAGAGSANVIL